MFFYKSNKIYTIFHFNLLFQKETSLCQRFTKYVTKYDLMTSDTLIVPIPQAETPVEAEKTTTESDA